MAEVPNSLDALLLPQFASVAAPPRPEAMPSTEQSSEKKAVSEVLSASIPKFETEKPKEQPKFETHIESPVEQASPVELVQTQETWTTPKMERQTSVSGHTGGKPLQVGKAEAERLISMSQALSEEEKRKLMAEVGGPEVQPEPEKAIQLEKPEPVVVRVRGKGKQVAISEGFMSRQRKKITQQRLKSQEAFKKMQREQQIASRKISMEQSRLTTEQMKSRAKMLERQRKEKEAPARIQRGIATFGRKTAPVASKVTTTAIGATTGIVGEAGRGVGAGLTSVARGFFGSGQRRGVSTKPLARLRSSGEELLGRDNKLYVLSPVAPSKGVRGSSDYDALEGTFGPGSVFSRDQAMKVLVNIHSSRTGGQNLYAIAGRISHLAREGYLQEVGTSQVAPVERGVEPYGIFESRIG